MDPLSILVIAALILSIIAHEVAHGYVANWLGDPTARFAGRLTLNPIPHIDLIGSIVVPGLLYLSGAGVMFGWAKPVPYNPYNLRDRKWGEALVAAAGPGTNLFIAVVFGLILRFGMSGVDSVFGLDAYAVIASVVYSNIVLAFFNLIPIPPLDGSKVLTAFLPIRGQMRFHELSLQVQQFGFFGPFLFIFLVIRVFQEPFSQLINTIFSLITGISFF
ncbi:site-2 protease family protein [Candidatus Kaiserbacteria bacterium]|nr:site-2 protease family protein [Candidatus Kaiserbacteria bacterium]